MIDLSCAIGIIHHEFNGEITLKQSVKSSDGPPEADGVPAPRIAPHLSATSREAAITAFEQALICAAEAFYRFASSLLGPVARDNNLTGQDCVILQQLVVAGSPRKVGDLLRFANRDDASNVQYSLRKLMKAGLARQVRGASKRGTAYEVTAEGARISARLVAMRREYLTASVGELADGDQHLEALTRALGLLTGVYDHGSRLMSAQRHED